MKNYQCKKCETLINSQSRPSSINCPSGGNHQWTDLGESGSTPYQCRKCGTLVNSQSRPSSINCPSGGNHQWNKLI